MKVKRRTYKNSHFHLHPNLNPILKPAVRNRSTCLLGGDGQNVAGLTGAQSVPSKYAEVISGGLHL